MICTWSVLSPKVIRIMKKYDARLIRDAITTIGLYFLDKCFINNVKHCRNSLITVAQSSHISTFKFTYVLTSLSVAAEYQWVYASFSYQYQTQHADVSKSYRCNTVSFFKFTSLFMLPRLADLFNFF